MAEDVSRKVGRPATGVERVQVRLAPADQEIARSLGDGNVSAGIRAALALAAKTLTKKR